MPVIVTSAAPSRSRAGANAACAFIAAWISSGTIAFGGPGGGRIGVLPIDIVFLSLALLAALVVFAVSLRDARATSIALSPLALLVLPWLPIPVPPAFLIWTGALTAFVWLGVAIALASLAGSGARGFERASIRRAAVYPAVAGCVVFGAAAWSASVSIPGGDEPHYLVITQSLLYDHDLKIENNHARGDYRAYFPGDLAPHVGARGRNGAVYSIHSPGVPELVLPAFALGGYH